MLKLSNQQVRAIAKKIANEKREKLKQLETDSLQTIKEELMPKINEYVIKYNEFVAATKALVDGGKVHNWNINTLPEKTESDIRRSVDQGIVAKLEQNKQVNEQEIIDEIHILTIDAETVEEILAHFNN